MRNSIGSLLASAALFCLVSGCAVETESPGDDNGGGPGASAQEIQVKEIATITIASAAVSFYHAEGSSDIEIWEQSPNGMQSTPLGQLAGQQLTSLEMFLTLAPERAAPAELAAAHEREALSLGRSSVEVRPGTLNHAALVEKSISSAQCSVMYNGNIPGYQGWVNRTNQNNLTGTQSLCGGVACQAHEASSMAVLLGICNSNSNASLPYRVYFRSAGSPTWFYWNFSVAPDVKAAHYRLPTGPEFDKIEGRPISGAHQYHLRAAIAYHQ